DRRRDVLRVGLRKQPKTLVSIRGISVLEPGAGLRFDPTAIDVVEVLFGHAMLRSRARRAKQRSLAGSSAILDAVAAPQRPPKPGRLRRGRDLQAVFERGRRFHGKLVTLVGCSSEVDGRLAIPCGRRFSKRAVDRNRFRRLVREAFREVRASLPGSIDFIVLPRCKPGDATFRALVTELPPLAN